MQSKQHIPYSRKYQSQEISILRLTFPRSKKSRDPNRRHFDWWKRGLFPQIMEPQLPRTTLFLKALGMSCFHTRLPHSLNKHERCFGVIWVSNCPKFPPKRICHKSLSQYYLEPIFGSLDSDF
ncbi:hypothetical protein AMTRI_Chr01g130840 [Amborella trichopoda]